MVGDLARQCRLARRRGGLLAFERIGDRAMDRHSFGRKEVVIGSFTNERMAEPVCRHRIVDLHEHALFDGFPKRRKEGLRRDTGDSLEKLVAHHPPSDGRDPEDPLGRIVERGEARRQDLAQRVRQ
jgi:hypothetical protein